MAHIVKFDMPPDFDSCGRNGYVITIGVEITSLSPAVNIDRDATLFLHPINSRGTATKNCRVAIARSALPRVIATLQQIVDAAE